MTTGIVLLVAGIAALVIASLFGPPHEPIWFAAGLALIVAAAWSLP